MIVFVVSTVVVIASWTLIPRDSLWSQQFQVGVPSENPPLSRDPLCSQQLQAIAPLENVSDPQQSQADCLLRAVAAICLSAPNQDPSEVRADLQSFRVRYRSLFPQRRCSGFNREAPSLRALMIISVVRTVVAILMSILCEPSSYQPSLLRKSV